MGLQPQGGLLEPGVELGLLGEVELPLRGTQPCELLGGDVKLGARRLAGGHEACGILLAQVPCAVGELARGPLRQGLLVGEQLVVRPPTAVRGVAPA